MDLVFNPFSITLIFSGLVVACLSLIIVIKMDDAVKWVAITMMFGAIWGVFYGLELSATKLETILILINVEYIGISFLPASWLIFALKYAEIDFSKYKVSIFFIVLFPTLTFLFVITNDLHHLHYTSYQLISAEGITGLKTVVGPWYIVHVIYSYLVFAIGNFIIWKRFRFSDKLFKTQTRLLFFAGLFPIIFNGIYQFDIYKPFELIDLTPYTFLFTYLIIGFAIIRYQLFSIKPIAKNIIFEAITNGVLVLDGKQLVVDFNPAIFNFFNTQQSVKIGVHANNLFEPFPQILELLNKSDKKTLEFRQSDEGSGERTTWIELIPLKEKGSGQSGTIMLFEDITKEVIIKELLMAQKAELEQLNNLKDKYFSIISHDLKGPIFGVKELIHLTQTGLISIEEFVELLPEISKNMENVSQLLENLLAWTSTQLRGEHVVLETFNIRKVLIQQKQLLDRIATKKNIDIIIDLPEGEFNVEGDKNMVDLILRNLINNALKFSLPSNKIILSVAVENEYTRICVQDFGKGISEENLKKINDGISFTTKGHNNEHGTGLGLVLVREYIKKNSGKLQVESIEGEGTKFFVYLLSGI